MALTPLRLKSSLLIHKDSPELQLQMINTYRTVLDELEDEIRFRGATNTPSVRRFSHWSPCLVENNTVLIWNPKKGRHGIPSNPLDAAKANLRAIGAVQFFCQGTITVEVVESISPILFEIVNKSTSARLLLSSHCAHLKNRAVTNAKETIPFLREMLLSDKFQDNLDSIYSLPLLKLFWKHLGGAVNIAFMYSNEDEPASTWAKEAFKEFLGGLHDDLSSDFSYSTFVRNAIEKGLESPDLQGIPLVQQFAANPRVKAVAASQLLTLQSDSPLGHISYVAEPSTQSSPTSSSFYTSPSSGITSLSSTLSGPTGSAAHSSTVGNALKRVRETAAASVDIFTPLKPRS